MKNETNTNISDLSKFKNKELSQITLVFENGICQTYFDEDVDSLYVNEDGYFRLCDFMEGLISFSEERKSYIHEYFGSIRTLNVIGFTDIKIKEESR